MATITGFVNYIAPKDSYYLSIYPSLSTKRKPAPQTIKFKMLAIPIHFAILFPSFDSIGFPVNC